MFKLQKQTMKKFLLFSMACFGAVISAFTPTDLTNQIIRSSSKQTSVWNVDKVHTSVKFSVSHLVISDVDGNFKSFDGTIESSKADFSDAKIKF